MSTITVAEPASSGTASRDGGGPRLRPHALGFPTLLAQSVALISPTMTAVLIITLAFGLIATGVFRISGALGGASHILPQTNVHSRVLLRSRHSPSGDMGTVGDDVEAELHAARRDILHS